MFLTYLLFISLCELSLSQTEKNYIPTVLWHGMGDSCCNPFSMGRIKGVIEDRLPGIYVYSVMIGPNVIADTTHGYYGNVNNQIKETCGNIKNDSQLANGFNVVGFSQGGQFLRGLVQQCSGINVRNLITFGGQHQGIFGLPKCPSNPEQSKVCEFIRKLLDYGAYESWIQDKLIQAQYWHDPLDVKKYKNGSIFLADINNENTINESYKANLQALSNFVMVKFLRDSMVVPRESSWFGFYAEGQDEVVLSIQNTSLYTQDKLGMKQMDKLGKLKFLEVDGDHLQFSEKWFIKNIVDMYLA